MAHPTGTSNEQQARAAGAAHTLDDVLGRLDASTRAVLELSICHRVPDEDLATLLRCDLDAVAQRRLQATRRLGAALTMLSTAAGEPHARPLPPRAGRPPQTLASPDDPTNGHVHPLDWAVRIMAVACLLAIITTVIAYKAVFIDLLTVDPMLTVYGVVVVMYIITRFGLSLAYRPSREAGLEPTVAIVMPAFNEQDAIARSLGSLLALEYPRQKLEIVAVDDGSTDGTLDEMQAVAADAGGVRVISFPHNRGKRAAMAAGIRATDAEVIAFVDSDSTLDPSALRRIVQQFAERNVGAVCGHAEVMNTSESWLTRMQAVRYFVAFRVVKAAESVFGAVTCCSGCFSAYRRAAIIPWLERWENQTFLGLQSTFGDDRALTNCVLRDWKVRYESRAASRTAVPATFHTFMRQQLRWKRSWTRESLIVSRFIWRKHPAASVATYVSIVLPLIAPVIAVRATLWQPLAAGAGAPLLYLLGIYAMAVAYGLYYAACRDWYSSLWVYGIVFCFFYVVLLIWQTYWAVLTARTTSWGTRPATAGISPAERGGKAQAAEARA